MEINIRDSKFQLHPSGALYWGDQKMLLIADMHLGKISHFRKHGSAVPSGAINANFLRLAEVVAKFQPENIVFLGDLFHSALNSEWKLFRDWKTSVSARVILIIGNHDIISPLKYEEVGVEIYQELIEGNFLLTHHPETFRNYFNICGHIHPGFRLIGKAKQQVKLPCFYKSKQQLVLPAFGEFTGLFMVLPDKGDEIYAITQKEVILVHSEK